MRQIKKFGWLLAVCVVVTVIIQLGIPLFMTDKSPLERISFAEQVSVLPKSLQIIGEEAFAGTSFQTLAFNDNLRYVGDWAFSDTKLLEEVYLPNSVEFIADSAFSNSGLQIIHGEARSYVEKWAELHGIVFEAADHWFTGLNRVGVSGEILIAMLGILCVPAVDESRKIKCYLRSLVISMRPQDRAELNPIDYRFP